MKLNFEYDVNLCRNHWMSEKMPIKIEIRLISSKLIFQVWFILAYSKFNAKISKQAQFKLHTECFPPILM